MKYTFMAQCVGGRLTAETNAQFHQRDIIEEGSSLKYTFIVADRRTVITFQGSSLGSSSNAEMRFMKSVLSKTTLLYITSKTRFSFNGQTIGISGDCATAGCLVTETCNLVHLVVEWVVNTMVLVWWSWLKYL